MSRRAIYSPLPSPLICLRRDFPSKRLASCPTFIHLQGGGASDLLVTLEEEPGLHSSAPYTSHPLGSSPPAEAGHLLVLKVPFPEERLSDSLLQVRKPHSPHPIRLLLDPSSSLTVWSYFAFCSESTCAGELLLLLPI